MAKTSVSRGSIEGSEAPVVWVKVECVLPYLSVPKCICPQRLASSYEKTRAEAR